MIEVADAVVRLVLWCGWTLVLLPVQIVAIGLDLELARRIPVLYHRGSLRLFRVDLLVEGRISAARPTLFIANHSSYVDILILASLIQGSFVAKSEVAGWPLIGLLARLQGSVFIDRRVAATRSARDEIERRLRVGHNLILFPEGTTSDGNRLLAFRTGLFGLADAGLAGAGLAVQPVTLAYTHQNGIPLGHADRARIAWFGDMELVGHFWSMLRLGRLTVAVRFHPAVEAGGFASRKALAAHCHHVIRRGLEGALRGRTVPAALDDDRTRTHNRTGRNGAPDEQGAMGPRLGFMTGGPAVPRALCNSPPRAARPT
ncbi:MAG TPA: lysophospholipid acyltransferase family protein [Geminicoccaceae bacterium]